MIQSTYRSSGGDLRLGTLLGRRQAFSSIAARCSAADASALREIRNQKVYRSLQMTFAGFCKRYLGISLTHVNRIIRYLEEFGPEYFELAQLTGISALEYRAIAPAVKDQSVHCGDQVIALLPENADKLAAAVAELRAAAPKPPRDEPSLESRLQRLERQSVKIAEEFCALSQRVAATGERLRFASILGAARVALERVELEFGRVV
ncbi:MAG TPA: hypothetical protein VKT49_24595 [Bryobacteraceae bacterium]|nr:hypothetical protein [Bryobacteraceae bacterium]